MKAGGIRMSLQRQKMYLEGLTLRSGTLAEKDEGAPLPASRFDRAAMADRAAAFWDAEF